MNAFGSVTRIVVVAPVEMKSRNPASTAAGLDTFDALARLGDEVEIELVHDAAGCLAAIGSSHVGLVLLDRVARTDANLLLDALRGGGPPVVVVTDEAGEGVALDAFRSGATDCVRVGDDYGEVLPVVVLEQLRRTRKLHERGVAERRIRDLQRYTDNIIQNLNSALLVVDAEGRITTSNLTAEEILGAEPGGLDGQLVWDWLAEAEPAQSAIGRTLADGLRFKGAETTVRRADGTLVPIGLSCSPLLVEGDATTGAEPIGRGAVAIFQDLSEIQQLQRQVLQAEKMASIGELAAGIAHEINNPMGFIHANLFQMTEYLGDLRQVWGRVEELQKAAQGSDLEVIRAASDALDGVSRERNIDFVQADFAKAVRESQEGSERIRHIVKDLRDFSHYDTAECVEADVNQCIDSTANIAWTMMKHSVVLEKEYRDLPNIRCYPMQLKQVFMNLLVNACQAIEERVGDSGETGTIHIKSERRGDSIVIAIRDSGAGIDPADVNRIFDPFFTTKEVGAGTGLGLATSYNIVQRHGGRIDVASRLGEGTTFEVWLPIAGLEEA